MANEKTLILKRLSYTDLVYGRINKKLKSTLSRREIEDYIRKVLKETNEANFVRKGKNYYVRNTGHNIRLTINSSTCRIITVDKLSDIR